MSLRAKEDSVGSAQHGSRVKRLETNRGKNGMRGGEVSANKGIKQRAGKGCRESDRKNRGETTPRNCMNGKSEKRNGWVFFSY